MVLRLRNLLDYATGKKAYPTHPGADADEAKIDKHHSDIAEWEEHDMEALGQITLTLKDQPVMRGKGNKQSPYYSLKL